MNVELSDRAHLEMQRINAAWRKQADFPELFLDELLETVKLIETTGVLGMPYQVKAKRRSRRLILVLTRATSRRGAYTRTPWRRRDLASGGTSRLRRLAPLGDHTTGPLTGCVLGRELLLVIVSELGRPSLRATGGGPQGSLGSGELPGSGVRIDLRRIAA